MVHYLSIAKTRGTATGCWVNPKSLSGFNFYGSDIESSGNYANFILNDSTAVSVIDINNFANPSYYYIQVLVDINGKAPPNIIGKDVFSFLIVPKALSQYNSGNGDLLNNIQSGGVYPDGYGMNRYNLMIGYYAPYRGYSKTANSSPWVGTYCTALIMLDGWKISDDYPW